MTLITAITFLAKYCFFELLKSIKPFVLVIDK